MRIGVNCVLLQPASGGVRQYFARLMTALLEEGRDDLTFFHRRERGPLLDELLPPSWRAGAVALEPAHIADAVRTVDVYFCPLGLLTPRPAAAASVVTLGDVQESHHPEFFSIRERWSRLYHHAASTRAAQRVITFSEFSRRSIAVTHRIPVAKIDVAYQAPASARTAEGVLPGGLPERFILYPANLWRHKNHEALLRALVIARDRDGIIIPCVLTGEEVPNGWDPRTAVARHRLEGQLVFLGYVPEDAMPVLYRRASALAFPSLFEGFGLPLVEAMAAGCPVACSRRTSLPEVAGDAAQYFEPDDPDDMARVLVQLWTDAALRADLAEKGRERARLFTLAAMVEAHRRAFTQARDDFAVYGPYAESITTRVYELLASGWQSVRTRPHRLASHAG